MKFLSKNDIQKFLKLASDNLTGEWILVGGTVLHALNIEHRGTIDIDLVNLKSQGNKELLQLLQLVEKIDRPPETINQASALFVHKLKPKAADLILLYEGKKSKIYRPNLKFYIQLKTGRFSENDYNDCLAMFEYSTKHKESFNQDEIIKCIETEIKKTKNPEKKKRLTTFLTRFQSKG